LNKLFLALTILLILATFGNNTFAQSDDKLVVLETNLGNIVIEFFPEDAPNHVANFIKLSESGFYDGTIFHRIIPDFMIQGGDPNTISGDPNTWGIGGPTDRVNAEFNTIKHNRGIVSMARSADPNSAGSQFFIVHKDSNFLDEQYTVFGRIITEESFQTLDKIAAVETGDKDNPIDPEQVRITKTTVVNRSNVSDILELPEPERTQSPVTPLTGNQKYQSSEHEIEFSVPEGWLLQQPDKTQPNSPDVVAVGPKTGVMNPVISLTIQEINQKSLDDLITEKIAVIQPAIDSGNLKIILQEKTIVNGYEAYVTDAEGLFSSNNEQFNVKFKEIMIYDTEKFYTLTYSNGMDDFDSQLPKFIETIDSFKILSNEIPKDESTEKGGGCLIATATYGSEMAPQVQQLRELRDNKLLQTNSGTSFMNIFNNFYYSFSPIIADYERENPIFKEAVKISITPMLSTLSILNYVDIDSEQQILGYGISLILLNIGMYFAVPTIIIFKIRK
jgi:peptidyl-prolyl cis-trans isomerase B (cyclophilin B)